MSDNHDKSARLAELSAELGSDEKREPVGVRRLREAREAAAARAAAPSDSAARVRLVKAGDIVHAISTGLNIPRTTSLWGGRPPLSLTRGDRIVVDEEMIEAARDRTGDAGWVALVHDPERQVRRWGRIHLAPGEPPTGMLPFEQGTPEWVEARENARREAWSLPTQEARAEALQRVHDVFGPPPVTSTTLAHYRDTAFEEQEARIAASVAAGRPNMGSL